MDHDMPHHFPRARANSVADPHLSVPAQKWPYYDDARQRTQHLYPMTAR